MKQYINSSGEYLVQSFGNNHFLFAFCIVFTALIFFSILGPIFVLFENGTVRRKVVAFKARLQTITSPQKTRTKDLRSAMRGINEKAATIRGLF